jgi:DNA invertase Pin-like site-specific DNA recombinase
MPRRQIQPRPTTITSPLDSPLTERPLTVLARQSTTRQIKENVESLKLQVEDQVKRYKEQGWPEDIITVRIEGGGTRGVSGSRLRIDQRTELQETLADIEADITKGVVSYSVSRLFRSKYGIDSGIFMETCAKHDCLVFLPEKTYDFNNSTDRFIFSTLVSVAAQENEWRTK